MENSSNNILLYNLIRIRWIAITGQFFAIILVYFYINITIPIFACLCIVFISAIINTFSHLSNKDNYLLDREAFYFLLFDTIQLGVLLYLTGGIYNPFSLLLTAPIIISASYLPIVYSLCLLVLSVSIVLLISNFYLPINWGGLFQVPSFFQYGLTLSLIISLIFIFIYVYLFANSSRKISSALTKTKSALENQKKLSAIGSLSAAAVHELSTPLNTIFLILNDLREEENVKNNINIKKEIDLLKSQADRCKDILLTLSKNPENLKDNFFNEGTISNIIKVSFDKFNYNKRNILEIKLKSKNNEPLLLLKEELIYSFGNIIQNATQHSMNKIDVSISWNEVDFKVVIKDDGMGFKSDILDQLGKPYISTNKKGMGLGIFISKNLIENIGGSIFFKNSPNGGAIVEILIKRAN